uniref:Alpha-ketoglutarate-dependent dioxygenase AlkB-like domain-containing protein n=1 Tax=Dendroctonus ponderosae TaxID=77166 RepID=A0AAR5Q0J6_DENPD
MILTGLKGVPKVSKLQVIRRLSSKIQILNNESLPVPSYFTLSEELQQNQTAAEDIINTMKVLNNFLSEAEETCLMNELDPYMNKLRYEFDHWDDAIHGYRETERLQWNEENTKILDRVRKIAFPPDVAPIKFVHILDLDKNGWIKPHIDAVREFGYLSKMITIKNYTSTRILLLLWLISIRQIPTQIQIYFTSVLLLHMTNIPQ